MRRIRRWAAAGIIVLTAAAPAVAYDGTVEKKTFSMPSYTTQIPGDGGHLDGVLAVAKVGETIRKFLIE